MLRPRGGADRRSRKKETLEELGPNFEKHPLMCITGGVSVWLVGDAPLDFHCGEQSGFSQLDLQKVRNLLQRVNSNQAKAKRQHPDLEWERCHQCPFLFG